MTTMLASPIEQEVKPQTPTDNLRIPSGTRSFLLSNVSWATYDSLMKDYESSSVPHFSYDRGLLEVLMPGAEHEEMKSAVALLVELVLGELDMDARNFGSLTLRREDLQRGFEPDVCFYIRSADLIEGKNDIDLTIDPPPDLVIEIDDTSSSLPKLPLYAAIGVPEVWRMPVGSRISILVLRDGVYQEEERSMVLPVLTQAVLTELMDQSGRMRRAQWQRLVRERASTSPQH